jgi:hypothetical protein
MPTVSKSMVLGAAFCGPIPSAREPVPNSLLWKSSNEEFNSYGLSDAVLGCLASTLAAAQQREAQPVPKRHAVNLSLSLSAQTNSPLQEQMREDYATGLMGAQRDLLQLNPSGLDREEQAIGRELNGCMGHGSRPSGLKSPVRLSQTSDTRLV